MQENGMLVFAGKEVGEEILSYLLTTNAPVLRVIAANKNDTNILAIAKSRGIPADVYHPKLQQELINDGRSYEWLVNLWSHHVLTPPILNMARRRLNVHTGLVPQSRGNCSATWTIRNGLHPGVSLLEMNKDLDEGAVYAQKPLTVRFPIRGADLQSMLKRECVNIFKEHWQLIFTGKIQPQPQVGCGRTFCLKETAEDRVLSSDKVLSVDELMQWILAHDFYPNTSAIIKYPNESYRVRVILEKDE